MTPAAPSPSRSRRHPWLMLGLLFLAIGLLNDLLAAIRRGSWQDLVGTLTVLAIVVLIFHKFRHSLQATRQHARQRFEAAGSQPALKEAALFSLTWSREIFQSIPEDRRPLFRQAYTLVGLGLLFAAARIGFGHVFSLTLIVLMVLSGVNLLVWVASSEREEKNRLAIELETACRMQMALMPASDPKIEGLDVSGFCLPAASVGGDHFDYVWLGPDRRRFGMAVADVSGKGMDAALTAVYTSGAFNAEAQHEDDLELMVDHLNSAIRSRPDRKRFVSFLLAAIDLQARSLTYVNAGQSRPILWHRGKCDLLPATNVRFPLGLKLEAGHRATQLSLEPGDRLLIYTDGASEAMNEAGEMYGQDRLLATFDRVCRNGGPARASATALRQEIVDFSGNAGLHDDLTVVVAVVETPQWTVLPANHSGENA